MRKLRIVLLSDTHNLHRFVFPRKADLIIHSGDMTESGTLEELEDFAEWWNRLNYELKIIVPGNHDSQFSKLYTESRSIFDNKTQVLIQSKFLLPCGLSIYGTPFIPSRKPGSFMLLRDSAELRAERNLIDKDVDILISHGPPKGILDVESGSESCGCRFLRDVVLKEKPTIHVFGHIHESGGKHTRLNDTLFVNAALASGDKKIIDKQPKLVEVDLRLLQERKTQTRRLRNEDIVSVLPFDT